MFKFGDKVKCIDVSGVALNKLILNKTYHVLKERDDGVINLQDCNGGWFRERFVKVSKIDDYEI